MGKQHRVSFNKLVQRKDTQLDLVYSDVCGPMKTRTLGGCSYFVTFIDDYSRKLWVYPLKTKNQVYEIFKQFHMMVEREMGESLKCIRTDNGGEYIGEFDQYCKMHDIRHEQSVPKTPPHNGLAERMNWTIVEKLDNKSRQCVYLSYGDEKFVYKLYDSVTKKIVRSRDVVFFEDQTIKEFNEEVQIDSGDRGLVEFNSDDEEDTTSTPNMSNRAADIVVDDVIEEGQSSNEEEEEVHGFQEIGTEFHVQESEQAARNLSLAERVEKGPAIRVSTRAQVPSSRRKKESLVRGKARLVVKGYEQKEGIDFEKIFPPVVKITSIRVVLGLVVLYDLEIEQLDVKTAFLHGDLEEVIFMEQPEGFVVEGKEHMVCRLKKNLYGLKQAPR
ncbi:hypothetical protein LIER_01062 [Lithospermum erythrorhizon]|uniref:Integrase catalytic domain-containing protein n=1 Tax=Lithospermum erythrorhizon TaxID=34254 RepID=A0AAV3NJN4_LITER